MVRKHNQRDWCKTRRAAVVDLDALEVPAPVPVSEDGGLRIIDSNIANSKLLVAYYLFSGGPSQSTERKGLT